MDPEHRALSLYGAVTLLYLLLAPGAEAEEGPDHYQTCYPAQVGVTLAGCADWYVVHPERIDGPGAYRVGVTASTSIAATGTLNIQAVVLDADGCTLGALSGQGSTQTATASLPLTVTGDGCELTVRFLLLGGTAELTSIVANLEAQERFTFLELMTEFAWLVWTLYVALTRLVPINVARLLVALAGFGILALDLGEAQFTLLLSAQLLVTLYDTYVVLLRGGMARPA